MIRGPIGIWIKIRLNPDLQVCLDHHFLSESHLDPQEYHYKMRTM